jgi:GTP-binding GTPase N-terminal
MNESTARPSRRGRVNSTTALVSALLVSIQYSSIASAFVPASRSLAASSSNAHNTRLWVLSSPPPSPAGPSRIADDGREDKPSPLFSLDGDGGTSSSSTPSGSFYQVNDQQQQQLQSPPQVQIMSPPFISDPDDYSFYYRDEDEILTEREDRLYTDEKGIRRKVEKCILIGVEDLSAQYKAKKAELYYDPLNGEADPPCFTLDESMIEMRELIRTAGMEIAGEITQRLQEVNPKTYVGSGKVQEAKALMEEMDCCTIVFDAELTPGQQKALIEKSRWWTGLPSFWIFLRSMHVREKVNCKLTWHCTNIASRD